jgi:hypothetical protein
MYCGGSHLGFPTKFVFYVDRKSKMAATAIHRLTLDPMGKCSNAFFSETTNIIKAKLYMNGNILPIGSNVKLSPAVAAILNFISEQKNVKFVEDHPMNIPVQFGFNNICSF